MKRGLKRICWFCLNEITSKQCFNIDYLNYDSDKFLRPISSFGLCSNCKAEEMYFGYKRDENIYTGVSAFVPEKQILVAWPSSKNKASRSRYRRIRKKKLKDNPDCYCGREATEINHLIPRYWIRLNGYKDNVCDFDQNLVPSCRACNQNWLTVPWEDKKKSQYWNKHDRAQNLLSHQMNNAFKRAEEKGHKIYKPPFPLTRELIAQPVLRKPENPDKDEFQLVGLVDLNWGIKTLTEKPPKGPTHFGSIKSYTTPYLLLEKSSC